VARPITFLSDYGVDDEFAGVCRAVIARIAPEATVIDLTHGVSRHAVRQGATMLANALPYAPPGVHLAVIDPGVGTPRRAVVVRAALEERLLVGPDNGLLWPAIERLGGAVEAVDVSLSRLRLEPISATFHGRDIFAPVAAHLARGAALEDAGDPLDPADLATVELPQPRAEDGALLAHALVIDRFGNVALNVDHEDMAGTGITLGGTVELEAAGERYLATYAQTFADVRPGELIVYEDAYRTLAVAINRGDAAATLALRPDAELRLRPR
jgi:S-adenosyl-L-methionine hydrolase (adenosine-forming)